MKQKNRAPKRKTKDEQFLSADDLFDDCAVCLAEKGALERGRPLSMEELKAAFQQANQKNSYISMP